MGSTTAIADSTAETRWRQVLLIVAAGVAAALHVGKVPPALPTVRAELGLDLVTSGWLIALFYAIGAAGGMPFGWLADRIGHRRQVLAGLALLSIGSLAGALTGSGAVLLVTRVLEGCGFIMTVVAAPTLVIRAARRRDTRMAFGLWGSFMPTGIATMMLLTPALLAAFGWRGSWLAASALTAVLAVAMARAVPPPAGGTSGGTSRLPLHAALWHTVRVPANSLLAASFALYAMSFIAVIGFLPVFLVENQGWPPTTAAVLTALVVAANITGSLATGWLARFGVPRWVLLAAASATMGLCAIGIFAETLAAVPRYLLSLLFSAAGGLLPAAVLSGAADHAPRPDLVASTSGLFVQGSNLGQLVGPPTLAAVVAGAGGWHAAPWFTGVAAAGGIAIALGVRATERRR